MQFGIPVNGGLMHYQTKMMLRDVLSNFRSFIYNLLYFSKNSPEESDWATVRNLVLSLPAEIKAQYAAECSFLESMPLDNLAAAIFPYPEKNEQLFGTDILTGKEKGLPFVIRSKGRRLFFPAHTLQADALHAYHILIDREGLLGTGTLAKSPHCYQDGDFKVEEGDVLLDVGCAEAVFTLDNIDKVSKAYLFECAPEWHKPLIQTFAPFSDKVVMVNKLVSDRTGRKSTTLLDAVGRERLDESRFFVKMDIEGSERLVIKGNADFFKAARVKLSCCVYHRQDDAQVIGAMLREMGYKTRFSDGYMLPVMNGIHYPYFRHGVIYAQNF